MKIISGSKISLVCPQSYQIIGQHTAQQPQHSNNY